MNHLRPFRAARSGNNLDVVRTAAQWSTVLMSATECKKVLTVLFCPRLLLLLRGSFFCLYVNNNTFKSICKICFCIIAVCVVGDLNYKQKNERVLLKCTNAVSKKSVLLTYTLSFYKQSTYSYWSMVLCCCSGNVSQRSVRLMRWSLNLGDQQEKVWSVNLIWLFKKNLLICFIQAGKTRRPLQRPGVVRVKRTLLCIFPYLNLRVCEGKRSHAEKHFVLSWKTALWKTVSTSAFRSLQKSVCLLIGVKTTSDCIFEPCLCHIFSIPATELKGSKTTISGEETKKNPSKTIALISVFSWGCGMRRAIVEVRHCEPEISSMVAWDVPAWTKRQ